MLQRLTELQSGATSSTGEAGTTYVMVPGSYVALPRVGLIPSAQVLKSAVFMPGA